MKNLLGSLVVICVVGIAALSDAVEVKLLGSTFVRGLAEYTAQLLRWLNS